MVSLHWTVLVVPVGGFFILPYMQVLVLLHMCIYFNFGDGFVDVVEFAADLDEVAQLDDF